MDGLKVLGKLRASLLPLVLALCARTAWCEPVLQCKKEIAAAHSRASAPTDVAVDAKGRVYVLHESDGFLDIYDNNGKLLQHRGGESEKAGSLSNITPLSMWVGRQGRSALLVSEPKQQLVRAVLVPDQNRLVTVKLHGHPEPMNGPAALARDVQGRFYVWVQNQGKVNVFDGAGRYTGNVPVPGLRRPMQLCVDGDGQLYCMDSAGLTVFKNDGQMAYELSGVTAMYLTSADRLAVASRNWIRRYNHDGRLEADVPSPRLLNDYEAIAISLNDENQFFVYGRDPMSGSGMIHKLGARGELMTQFPQPTRRPAAPDPGTRLDYEGRVRVWDNPTSRWLKLHPGGKREASWSFVAEADTKGHLSKPAGLAIDGEDTAWIADAGNCRLQRFNLAKGGWQKPFVVGLQGADPRGIPRSLALGRGMLYCVVYPPRGQGNIVLQARDREGKLLTERALCSAQGDPVVKVACGPTGDIFVYQSRCKVLKRWEDTPNITRYSPTFQKLAEIGRDGMGLSPPSQPNQRLFLKPQEDMIPYGQGLLLPTNGTVYRLNVNLQIEAEYKLQFKQHSAGAERLEDFGGGAIHGKLLYLSDMGNQCVQRVILP